MNKHLLALAVMACLLAKPSNAQMSPLPRLNQAQAIEIASTFCRAMSFSAPSTATASYPVEDDPDPTPELGPPLVFHWQPRWKVEFNNGIEIEVVDATGVVNSYYNSQYFNSLDNDQLAGPFISSADAIARAIGAISATGQSEELGVPEAEMHRMGDGKHVGDCSWEISWPRQLQSIPYKGDGSNVSIDAETGTVIGISLTYAIPPPNSTTISITQDQARSISIDQMNRAGIITHAGFTNVVFKNSPAQIVMPNTFWSNGSTQPPVAPIANTSPTSTVTGDEVGTVSSSPGGSRVAWVCCFTVTQYYEAPPIPPASGVIMLSDELRYEVWVDAQTGEVIGGDYIGPDRGIKAVVKRTAIHKKVSNHKRTSVVHKNAKKVQPGKKHTTKHLHKRGKFRKAR